MTDKKRHPALESLMRSSGMSTAFINYYFDKYDIAEFATIKMFWEVWKAATDHANEANMRSMGFR